LKIFEFGGPHIRDQKDSGFRGPNTDWKAHLLHFQAGGIQLMGIGF
jgi:hypothetical protein